MNNKLNFRPLKEEDYKTICEWWKWWRWPVIPREMLPDKGKSGFIVEKNNIPIVSAFLYLTNSTGALLEWIVSNPEYREDDRKEATSLLISGLEHVAKISGCEAVISIGKNKSLMNIHESLGYTIDKTPSYEISKKITKTI